MRALCCHVRVLTRGQHIDPKWRTTCKTPARDALTPGQRRNLEMMTHAARLTRCTLFAALVAFGTGCGSSGESKSDPVGGDGSGGSGGSTTSPTSAACDGAFTSIEAPYAPNTSIQDWGGFVADEQGL